MSSNPSAGPNEGKQFVDQIGNLANAIEERPAIEVERAPKTRSNRQVFWLIACLCALAIGIAELTIIMGSDTPEAPPASSEQLAALQNDACVERMNIIMSAISAYATANGAPPRDLAALNPKFIDFPPVDPTSHEPFGYEVRGEMITLSCPSAERPVAPAEKPPT